MNERTDKKYPRQGTEGSMMTASDTVRRFADAMSAAGLSCSAAIEADGQIHRFHVEGDKAGTRNGWYFLHLAGRPAGQFGSWKAGHHETWIADGKPMDSSERAEFAALVQAARRRAQAEQRAKHEAQAAIARQIWMAAGPADPGHEYLKKKHVLPHELRQQGEYLVVPLFDQFGLLWNVQRIAPDGGKRFHPGRAGGLYSPIGDFSDPQKILICEGWATGATLHEETGLPVLCAMNAGNLLKVAEAARASWPAADLVICADNDRHTDGNPGVTAARAAAQAVGARVIVPQFPDDVPGSDFNDLASFRRGVSNE